MKRLDWSPGAIRDLRTINNYLTKEAAPDIAVRILARIVEQSELLPAHPNVGTPLGNAGWRKRTVRRTRYVLIYRVTGDLIEILRVRHMAEDWSEDRGAAT